MLLYLKSQEFKDSVNVFGKTDVSYDDVRKAAVDITLKLYNGKPSESLESLRHAKFNKMVSEKVLPEELPPTEAAIFHHALRVHLQVSIWMTLDLHCLDPQKWGWELSNGILNPIKTNIDAAPEHLLKVVRCNCKTSSKRTCEQNTQCSCRKNGLRCVSACGDCRGISCANQSLDRTGTEMDDDCDMDHLD